MLVKHNKNSVSLSKLNKVVQKIRRPKALIQRIKKKYQKNKKWIINSLLMKNLWKMQLKTLKKTNRKDLYPKETKMCQNKIKRPSKVNKEMLKQLKRKFTFRKILNNLQL